MAFSKFTFVAVMWLLLCPSTDALVMTVEAKGSVDGVKKGPSGLGESSWGQPFTIDSVFLLFFLLVFSLGSLGHMGLILLVVFLLSLSLSCWAVILGMLLAPNSVLSHCQSK